MEESKDIGSVHGASSQHTLDFVTSYDIVQKTLCDPVAIAKETAKLLRQTSSSSVLDCAAGTGIPSLYLRQLGFDVYCSDGNPDAVRKFQENAQALGVSDQCDVRLWEDLSELGQAYDYVLCSGNSIVYNHEWPGSDKAAKPDLTEVFRNFAAVVKPGGYLHIDGPRTTATVPTRHKDSTAPQQNSSDRSIDDYPDIEQLTINENVSEVTDGRHWECVVSARFADDAADASYTIDLTSAKLSVDDFVPMLEAAGFGNFQTPELAGMRDSHQTLLAQKLV